MEFEAIYLWVLGLVIKLKCEITLLKVIDDPKGGPEVVEAPDWNNRQTFY